MGTRAVSDEELATPLIPYEQARARVLAEVGRLPPADTELQDALGLVTAEPVVAERYLPGFDNSAMDGYAVRSADVGGASARRPALLALAGDGTGAGPDGRVGPGVATKVMTGAPLPPGTDAVVPWEDAERRNGSVAVRAEACPGQHVRPRGSDVRAGDTVVEEGTVLGPVHLAVLAALGRTHVRATPRPRLAVLSTGDELVPPGSSLGPGQVHDANATLLTATARAAGATVEPTGMLGDDAGAIGRWLASVAPSVDLVVTTGGASVGERDWARAVLAERGQVLLWRVAIRPGKPLAFGRLAGTPVLVLPGNPASAAVCAHAFVAPAVRVMSGRPPDPPSVPGRLAGKVEGSPDRTFFCRVRLEGSRAEPLPEQSSGVISNLVAAHGLAVVPPGGLPEGAPVRVELLR